MSREQARIFAVSWSLFALSLLGIAVSHFIILIPETVYLALVYLFIGIGLPFLLYAPLRHFTRRRIPSQSVWLAVSVNVYLAFLVILLSSDWLIQSELWSNPVYEQYLAIGLGELFAGIIGVFCADLIRNAVLKKYPIF